MKKKLIASITCLCMLLVMLLSSTLAWFTDQQFTQSTMTVGKVKITQELTKDNKNIRPNDPFKHTVTITNDGNELCYVRTIFAFEDGDYEDKQGISQNVLAQITLDGLAIEIPGVTDTLPKMQFTVEENDKSTLYTVGYYVHAEALNVGDAISPLDSFTLKQEADNAWIDAVTDTMDKNYDILVLSQACQKEGLGDVAKAALDTSFGTITSVKCASWFGDMMQANTEAKIATAEELQEAINNGQTNIVLENHIVTDEPIVIPASNARSAAGIEINLKGKTITGTKGRDADNNRINVIVNNGILTIKNGTVTSAGENGGSAIYNAEGATLTIEDVTVNGAPIVGTEYWPSYGINNYGILTVNSATINTYHGGIATCGGAVTVINDATIDVGQSTMTKQTSWALYVTDNGKLTVNDGVFKNTKDENGKVYGGGYICATSSEPVEINGGIFDKSEGDNNGNGFYYRCVNLVIKGGTFDADPSAYVADGYKAAKNTDGSYTVKFPQESFDNLIQNAGENATVEIPAGEYTFPASDIKAGQTLICAPGTVFEGKSAMNINGATVIGATFSNPNGVAGAGTINGTFKDCVFEGSEALRWCYAGETVVFENCEFKTDFRGVHFDGMDNNVIFRNCKINGFNAFGGTATVTFEGCTFGYDESRYNGLNMYCNTVLKDCKFEYVSGKTNFIDFEEAGHTLTITNCTATLDGEAANVLDFVGGTYKNQTNITVDGALVVSTAAALQSALDNGVAKIALGANLAVTGDNMFTVPTGAAVAIDLNGHNISADFAAKIDGASAVFTINKNASLTIEGEGNVHVVAAPTLSYVSSVFTNLGSLTINGGNYSMDYGTYAEDYLIPTIVDTNSNVGKATTVINGGTFTHTRNMFRNFAQAQRGANNATLIINGGTFMGQADDYATIWNQKTSSNGVEGDGIVTINGGDFQYMDICNDFATGVTIAEGLNIAVQS